MTLDCVHCGRAVDLPADPRDGDEVPCACGGKNRVTCDSEPMSDEQRRMLVLLDVELSRPVDVEPPAKKAAPNKRRLRRLLKRLWEHR